MSDREAIRPAFRLGLRGEDVAHDWGQAADLWLELKRQIHDIFL